MIDKLWENLFVKEHDLRFMKGMNEAHLSDEPPYSDQAVEDAQKALQDARKAIEEHFKAVGSLSAYRDARELIADQDAGSIDFAITTLTKKVSG